MGLLLAGTSALAQTSFTVNVVDDRSDFNPGDGACAIEPFIFPPECSLRAALEEANATVGAVTIEFSDNLPIDTFGRSIIQVESALPEIENRVTIDGASRSDYVAGSRQPRVVIRYTPESTGLVDGLVFISGSSRSTVRAMAVENFTGNGIVLMQGDRYTVEECNIGLSWHPAAVSTNGNGRNGIFVFEVSSSGGGAIVIRNNLIAYNSRSGVAIAGGSEAVFIYGNVIGLRPPVQTETRFVPAPEAGNAEYGVDVTGSAGFNNIIGLIEPNTISNNGQGEVRIGAGQQTVSGNLIGLPHEFNVAPGFSARDYGRGAIALEIQASDNVIGGDIASGANHIGNAGMVNLQLTSQYITGNRILSNFIGVMPDGTDVSASQAGIRIVGAENTLIDGVLVANHTVNILSEGVGTEIFNSTVLDGGTGILLDRGGTLGAESFSDPNVIGNNETGIRVRNGAQNVFNLRATRIRANYIGTNATGEDLGNGIGLRIDRSLSDVPVTVDSNVIGFSLLSGIRVVPAFDDIAGLRIIRNRIGIDPSGQPIPNQNGIFIGSSSEGSIFDVTVGHSTAADNLSADLGNLIVNNTSSAVALDANTSSPPRNVTVRGNRIFGNAKGIDLGPGGDSVDPGDFDSGPNGLRNFPEFDPDQTFIDPTSGDLQYRFRVQTSPSAANYPLLVDFYLADGQAAQGAQYLGSVSYEEQDAQEWVSDSLTPAVAVSVTDQFLVGTASTRVDLPFVPLQGETSEFTSVPVSLEPDLPEIRLQPAVIDFGDVPVGSSSSGSFLIRNVGEGDLMMGSFSIGGPHAGDFSILAPNNCDGATIAPGLSCVVDVVFLPTDTGVRRAEVDIPSNDPESPHSLELSGGLPIDGIFSDSFESP